MILKVQKVIRLEAWSTAAALAAVTEKIEIMAAVRPAFHNPAVTAKMAANIDQISNGRFTLNVVSAWWEEEAKQYGGNFTEHDERYERTEEFLDVLKGLWTEEVFNYEGKYYTTEMHACTLNLFNVRIQFCMRVGKVNGVRKRLLNRVMRMLCMGGQLKKSKQKLMI